MTLLTHTWLSGYSQEWMNTWNAGLGSQFEPIKPLFINWKIKAIIILVWRSNMIKHFGNYKAPDTDLFFFFLFHSLGKTLSCSIALCFGAVDQIPSTLVLQSLSLTTHHLSLLSYGHQAVSGFPSCIQWWFSLLWHTSWLLSVPEFSLPDDPGLLRSFCVYS
jgi:hypothetical protein